MKPRIAFLTGQSDPPRCALSPVQAALLAELQAEAPEIDCIGLNYPWRRDSGEWRPVSLWRASLANARQYLAARRADEASLIAAGDWLQQAPRSLLLVGSCGLSLLEAVLHTRAAELRGRLRVVAYGAVGPRWPQGLGGHALLGRRDHIAALLGPRMLRGAPVTQSQLDCGHMDYLQQAEARAALRAAALAQLDWLRGVSPATAGPAAAEACSVAARGLEPRARTDHEASR